MLIKKNQVEEVFKTNQPIHNEYKGAMLKNIYSVKKENQLNNFLSKLDFTPQWEHMHVNGSPYSNNVNVLSSFKDSTLSLVECKHNSRDSLSKRVALMYGLDGMHRSDIFKTVFGHTKSDMSKATRSFDHLKRLIRTQVEDGVTEKKPNITIRDHGTGLTGKQMIKSFLNLMSSNKVGDTSQAGSFGYGGSTSVKFADLTFVITKPFDGDNTVYWTVIKEFNDPDSRSWKYLLNDNLEIPSFIDSKEEFSPGLAKRHIGYSVGDYYNSGLDKFNNAKDCLSNVFNTRFYDLDFPMSFDAWRSVDLRQQKKDDSQKNVSNPIIAGAENFLIRNASKHLDYSSTTELLFTDAYDQNRNKIKLPLSMRTYVISKPSSNAKRNESGKYFKINDNASIMFTKDNQVHGAVLNNLSLRGLNFDYIKKDLIVLIDCSNMSYRMQTDLFASTRDETVSTDNTMKSLITLVNAALSNDDGLNKLEEERKQKATKNSYEVNRGNELLQQMWGKAPKGKLGNTKGEWQRRSINSEKEEIEILPFPTFLEISDGIINAYGKTKFNISFKTNTDYSFVKENLHVVSTLEDHITYNGFEIKKGYGKISFTVNKHIPLNHEGTITILYRNTNLLSNKLVVCKFVEKKDPKGNDQIPDYKIVKVGALDENYEELFGHNPNKSAVFVKGDTIFVNQDNISYFNFLEKYKEKPELQQEKDKEFQDYLTVLTGSFYLGMNSTKDSFETLGDEFLEQAQKKSLDCVMDLAKLYVEDSL